MARLTEMQRKEIVAEFASGEYSKAGLARKYKVSYNTKKPSPLTKVLRRK